jgi:hypothetical protein
VDKKTLIRKTGRKILKFIKENDTTVKVEYYSNNPTNADWTGTAHYNSFKRRLYLRLKTSLNTLRNMSIDFHVSQISTPTIVKAYLSFTTMKEMDKEIQTKIFLVKAICSEDLSLAEFSTGEDPSIKEIEEKLKHVKAKTISINQTCNHCTGDI